MSNWTRVGQAPSRDSPASVALRLQLDVTITRIASRARDGHTLQGACKAVRDGIADALGLDDPDEGIAWSYGQRRGKAREFAVEVSLAERGERQRKMT